MRESSGVAAGLTSLPTGSGGIAPLGDRFQPDFVRGGGSYAVPLNLPLGPNESSPDLSLNYSTGSGNGPVGLGWRMNTMRIERRTDRGVPTYGDDDEFVIGGAEVLVPIDGARFRPMTETRFWNIERMPDGWRIRTGDGHTMLFGQTAASREEQPGRTFAWCLDETRDPAGNSTHYRYERDNDRLLLSEIEYSIFRVAVVYEPRPDMIRDGRAGFQRTTTQRATRLDLHCSRLAPTRMRSWHLNYVQAANGVSMLSRIGMSGTADGVTVAMPDLHMTYSAARFDPWQVHTPTARIAPPLLGDGSAQLVDLTANGLPDVLQTIGSSAYLWTNDGEGGFDGPTGLDDVPTSVNLSQGNVAFADLNGNGRVDLFAVDQPLQLAFESNGRGGFDPNPVVFSSRPTVGLTSPTTRLVDMNGDGIVDVIATERSHHLIYEHEPGVGWRDPIAIPRNRDLREFPDLSFDTDGVYVSDMTGDGLRDFVLVRSGDVHYWPSLGRGTWGSRVSMNNPPQLPAGFRYEHLYLLDIDGDGCTDLVYVDHDQILIWLNLTGGGFADPIVVPIAPTTGSRRLTAADWYGDGRLSLGWDATSATDHTGYRVLRFDGGTAPYLLEAVDNGLGGRFEMEYSTTTAMAIADRKEGRPWTSTLPVVIPVVGRIRQIDGVTNRTHDMSIRYHDGVWDGPSREFRGFRATSVTVLGDHSIPTSRQELTFFQGDPEHHDLLERTRQRALAGSPLTSASFDQRVDGSWFRRQSSAHTWDVRLEHLGTGRAVFFPHVREIEAREHSATAMPDRIERTVLENYDAHGNPGTRRRNSFFEGDAAVDHISAFELFTYTDNEADWLIKMPVRLELRDGGGTPHAVRVTTYDGAPFVGLPEGQADAGLATRTVEMKLRTAALPADWLGGRDLTTLGYEALGVGATEGFYAPTASLERDGRGNVIGQRDARGNTLRMDYDGDGVYPLRTVDALGRETELIFEPRAGEPSQIVMPDGRRIRYRHDALGRLVAQTETDDAGDEQLVKAWIVDSANIPTSLTSIAPDSAGQDFEVLVGAPDLAALADVSISRQYYDGFGGETLRVSRAADTPAGGRNFVAHPRGLINPLGLAHTMLPSQFVADLGFVLPPASIPAAATRTRYSGAGAVEATAGPGAAHFRVLRDTTTIQHFEGAAAGPFNSDPPPGPASRVEHFDARARMFQVDEARGDGTFTSTRYELAVDGRIQAVIDDAGVDMSRYTFAGPTPAVRIAHRDAGVRSYYHDAMGQTVERIEADNARLEHRFDALQRIEAIIHHPVAGPPVTLRELFYDVDPTAPSAGRFLDGRLAVAREGTSQVRYSYNRAGATIGEELTVDGASLTMEREYDHQGRLTGSIHPDGARFDFTLDDSGAVSAIPGLVTETRYDADGQAMGFELANGMRIEGIHDPASRRLTELQARIGTNVLRRVVYGYDGIGNIASVGDHQVGTSFHDTYGYDAFHRLTSFTVRQGGPAGGVVAAGGYSYDDRGEIRSLDETGPVALSYDDVARPGRITTVASGAGTDAVSYDDRGNITSVGAHDVIDYDAFDRITRVLRDDGTEITYDFDHRGRRLRMRVRPPAGPIRETRYVGSVYEEHADHVIRNHYFGGRLIATDRVEPGTPDTRAFFFCDHHGTVLLGTDDAGVVLQHQRYSPFGLALDNTTTLDRYLGKEKDEAGLIQFGARSYLPAIGRFTSPDWFVIENPDRPARLPQGYTVYGYALNNPLVFRDPSGMWFGLDDLIVFAVGFVVGFVTGLVYGLVNGQGWDSLLTALETGLTTGAGAWLGWTVGGPVGAIMGGMNGLISGVNGTYDWTSIDGWFAFISDSSWGLIGTSLGNIVHVINLFYDDANYRGDLSRRQNRHVYEGGFALKENFAFTQGNVISNAGLGRGAAGINASFIADHEELHIWQSRFFGPLFQTTYIVWGIGGFLVGTVVWFFNTDEDYGSLIETAAYYDNPFEYWAYSNDSNWPPSGANPLLTY